jgi:hypothetical protein
VNDTKREVYQPSSGALYGFVGVALIAVGGMSFANAHENEAFGILGLLFAASGLYVTVAGAVARGIQLAREQAERPERQ